MALFIIFKGDKIKNSLIVWHKGDTNENQNKSVSEDTFSLYFSFDFTNIWQKHNIPIYISKTSKKKKRKNILHIF